MKLVGITGTGSGKLGNSVFSVNAGEQIVRQYQPNVANPSTGSQVNNRARLKLLSQLSCVMGDVIAIPKEGMKSSRNLFVADNYQFTAAEDGVASVQLASLTLTRGGIQIPAVFAERIDTTSIDVELSEAANKIVSRVVYIMFVRNGLGELQLIDSAVVETAGESGKFPYSFAYQTPDVVIYAYGIYDKSAKASAKFGNYFVTSGTQVADLIAERKLSDSDYLVSKTKGIVLVGESTIEVTSCVANTVAVPASGSVSVPYDSSVAIEVNAIDVAGKNLSVLVDGVRGEVRGFNESGYSFVGAFDLAGGEQIRIQIGSMVGSTFVPEFTYGGTVSVSAQASAFTSVTANGAAVAAAGNTQIAQAASIAFAVAATGVDNKYLRLSVNGAARTPIAFSNGAASETLSGLSIDDVVTFAIGHMSGSTFIQDVAFGGSAVVAEVPATFGTVTCNGITIAPNGTTDVQAQDTNVYVINTANAIGKYLGVIDDGNVVAEVIPISQASFEYTDNASAGDTTKFAIGTGSTPQTFQAQTNFGGTVNFVDAPASGITSLTIGGESVTANKEINVHESSSYNGNVQATFADCDGKTFAAVASQTKPAVGSTPASTVGSTVIASDAASAQMTLAKFSRYWFVVLNSGTVESVFDYNVLITGSND